MPDRFDASLAALERGDVDLAAELELSQRPRRSDWKGKRDRITISLVPEQGERVRDIAGSLDRPISEIAATLIDMGLEALERRDKRL